MRDVFLSEFEGKKTAALFIVAVFFFSSAGPRIYAADTASFSGTNSALASAYAATLAAENHGGNVSALVAELNTAISSYQNAIRENATNPSAAALDLANASQLASEVIAQAPAISAEGASLVRFRDAISISSAIAIGVLAGLVYLFGGRIYRRLWYSLYKDYVVRSGNDAGE